mmetsp:Transcript_6435/g.6324  ORF Transcript_6435/g.6324 Transcript_6435/m.6324 type:complete len:616 (+) Transcript_6435:1-1848(+)
MANGSDLHKFTELGKLNEVKCLIERYSFDAPTISKALWTALNIGSPIHIEIAKILLPKAQPNYRDNNGVSFLMKAAKIGDFELVRMLIELKCSSGATDREKKSVLIHALEKHGDDPIRIVSFLLSNGANANISDIQGFTPLHFAAQNGFVDSVNELIESRADINAKNINNDTPLHLAVRNNYRNCVELLLERGANVRIQNNVGKTPINEAQGNIFNLLTGYGQRKEENKKDNNKNKGKNNRVKNYRKRENHEKSAEEIANGNVPIIHSCLKCKKTNELYCISCARELLSHSSEEEFKILIPEKGSIEDENRKLKNELEKERKNKKKLLDKLKALEKANSQSPAAGEEPHADDRLYSIKLANQPNPSLFMRPVTVHPHETVMQHLQQECKKFLNDLSNWARKSDSSYREVVEIISANIKEEFPDSDVKIYGSFETNLHLPHSDIDLVITNLTISPSQVLQTLIPKLKSLEIVQSIDDILTASIPLLKVKTLHNTRLIQVDISVQDSRHSGLACSDFVKSLLKQYHTLRHVTLLFKQLIYFSNFHEPFKRGLSSYGLLLMITWYYQSQGPEWIADFGNDSHKVADIFVKILYFYAWEFDYSRKIAVNNPELPNLRDA